MAEDNENQQQQIIINKIIKKGQEGHHGGSWKVAYADFVTAMMAFFLLLWLLNVTSEEQRKGISNYFNAITLSDDSGGSGGILGGLTMAEKGAQKHSKSNSAIPLISPKTVKGEEVVDKERQQKATIEKKVSEIQQDLKKYNESLFNKISSQIKKSVQNMPDIRQYSDNILMDITPEGIRIQLIDKENKPMFPLGSNKMYDHMRKLLGVISNIIKTLPNKISIIGHTDAKPYAKNVSYGNWELSTDRSNASRRALKEFGIPDKRVKRVEGKAANELLIENDPYAPSNRRISIILVNDLL